MFDVRLFQVTTLRARQFAGKFHIGEMLKIFNGTQVAAFPLNPYRFGILYAPIQHHGSKVFVWNTMVENWLGGKGDDEKGGNSHYRPDRDAG